MQPRVAAEELVSAFPRENRVAEVGDAPRDHELPERARTRERRGDGSEHPIEILHEVIGRDLDLQVLAAVAHEPRPRALVVCLALVVAREHRKLWREVRDRRGVDSAREQNSDMRRDVLAHSIVKQLAELVEVSQTKHLRAWQ